MDIKSLIENHIRLGEISEAINLLMEMFSMKGDSEEDINDSLLLGARWSSLCREYKTQGTISREAFEYSQNKVILGIQHILKSIKNPILTYHPKVHQYEIFLSTMEPELNIANKIFEILHQKKPTFLRNISLSEDNKWLSSLTIQSFSKLSVIFIDNINGYAQYNSLEYENALNLEKNLDNRHKMIVLYVNDIPIHNEQLPFALRGRPHINLIKEKSIESSVQKICNLLDGWIIDNESLSSIQNVDHPLQKFPRGPMVEAHLVSLSIIQNYARLIKPREAMQIIAEANAFRLEADLNSPSATIIKDYQLLPVHSVTPYEFWLDAFKEARLHGPRMLAALLMVVPDFQFEPKAQEAKRDLLNLISKS